LKKKNKKPGATTNQNKSEMPLTFVHAKLKLIDLELPCVREKRLKERVGERVGGRGC